MSSTTIAQWDTNIPQISFAQWVILHLAFATVGLYVSAVIDVYWGAPI